MRTRTKPKQIELNYFKDFTKFPERFFKLVTFDLRNVSKQRSHKKNLEIVLSDIFFWLSATNVCLFVSLSVTSALHKSSDIVAVTFSIPLLSSVLLVLIKSLTVYCNKSNICNILTVLKEIFPKEKNQQRKFGIQDYFKSYRKFVRIYSFMFMVPCCCVIVLPLVKLVMEGDLRLPLNLRISLEFSR